MGRSVVEGAGLMEAARCEGWALHFADLDIDTSTPAHCGDSAGPPPITVHAKSDIDHLVRAHWS